MHRRLALLALLTGALLGYGARAHAAEFRNGVVAVVNHEAITELDLEAALFDQAGTALAEGPKAERLHTALQQLIEERLILQAAAAAKLSADDAEIEERLRIARSRFPSEAAFESALMQEGITRGMLRKRYRDHVIMQRIIEQEVRARITVTPSEVAKYYREHPVEMQSASRVQARHLMLRITAERPEAETLSAIESLRRKIVEGAPFAELAKTASEGPEAGEGGDLGWVSPGQLRPELDEVLFRMAPGELSEPIRTDLGYHLVQAEDRDPVRTWSFDEVHLSIREKILRQKFEAQLGRWLAELRAKAYVVIKMAKVSENQ